jgi:hypothetical protein
LLVSVLPSADKDILSVNFTPAVSIFVVATMSFPSQTAAHTAA